MSKLDQLKDSGESDWNTIKIEIPTKFKLGEGTKITIESASWNDLIVDDILKMAALCGILIYSENLHPSYFNFVNEQLSNERAIYVFVDSTLNYGNSFPFNNGIILNEMSHHSPKTLCQLMARAGRPGVSDSAMIYAGNEIIEKVFNKSIYNDPNYIDIELENLNRCVKTNLDELCL